MRGRWHCCWELVGREGGGGGGGWCKWPGMLVNVSEVLQT